MPRKILTMVLTLTVSAPAFAAHIVTETTQDNVPIKRTHHHANAAGDLRIDEQSIGARTSMSAEGGTGQATTEYLPGRIQDTTLYQSKDKAIVSLEGTICRKMTADSAPPPGMPTGADMNQMNNQWADAMKQANQAMEQAMNEARKQGMTKEQERELEKWTKPFMDAPTAKKREVTVEDLNDTMTVAGYTGNGYLITDERGEQIKVYVTKANKIPGGKHVRKGIENMFGVYSGYMDKIGGGGLIDGSSFAVFMKGEFAGTYPIYLEELSTGEITRIIEANAKGKTVEYYPKCEVRSMMGN